MISQSSMPAGDSRLIRRSQGDRERESERATERERELDKERLKKKRTIAGEKERFMNRA